MGEITQILRPKYLVQRLGRDGTPLSPVMFSTDPDNVDSPFVLMPRKDPIAYEAVRFYADLCEPQLGNELRAWLRTIAEDIPVYGTQGIRNRTALRLKVLADSR